MADSRKRSFLLDEDHVKEMRREAYRLNKSVSWVFQEAWRIYKETSD